MSTYEHLSGLKRCLEERLANGYPIYIQKVDGEYRYHPDVEAEFRRHCIELNGEYIPTEKYSPSQVQTLKSHVKYLLDFGVRESLYSKSLTGVEKVKQVHFRRDQQSLLTRYFGGKNIDEMTDQEFVNIYDQMVTETSNYSKLNSVLIDKVQSDPTYQKQQQEIEEQKNKKNIFQKIAANKVFKAVIGNRIKALFTTKDSPLMQQAKGLKPIAKELRLKNINLLIAAFENLPKTGQKTIQAEPRTASSVPPISTPPVSTSTPPLTDERTDVAEGGTIDFEWRDPFAGVEYTTGIPETEGPIEGARTAEELVVEEPTTDKTTIVRKTVTKVKPVTLEEVVSESEKFGDYPTMTHINDSKKGTIPRGWHHEGEIAVGKDANGNPIIVSVYQNPNSDKFYYGIPRMNKHVKGHQYVDKDLEAGHNFGEIKVGKKNDVGFRYKINEDGTLIFVASELMAQFENGTATRKVEEYVEEDVEVVVPFDGDVYETQENGAPVALREWETDFNPPKGVKTKTLTVRIGEEQIYGEIKTYKYYEDPVHKGTFLIKEVISDQDVFGTHVSEAEWESLPKRLVLHSDAYDQDFNFEPIKEAGIFKNVDHIVEQERIEAERQREEQLNAEQDEELRIQREQAEIDKKKDYKQNGPDPELYDFGDKKYPTFKQAERQDQLHGHEKLTTVIPVGVREVTLPDGTTQRRVVAVEVWRSKSNPDEYLIGDEVVVPYTPDRYKEELVWKDGVSPVIDINNHKGSYDREPVNVVISRDENGKVTIVSAEFVQDYETGKVNNKFSEKVSGVPEPPKPDVTAKMPNEYVYTRLHQEEYIKYCKKNKMEVGELDSMKVFYESKGSPQQQVESFRTFVNNEAEVSRIIDYNTVAHKEYLKYRKQHPNMSEQEARIQYMLEYRREFLNANASGKAEKFAKKYAKGQQIPPATMDETNGTIVGGLNPDLEGKASIVAEQMMSDEEQKEIDSWNNVLDTGVMYVDGATATSGTSVGATSTNTGATDGTTGTGDTTTDKTTTTIADFDYYNQGNDGWTMGDNGGYTFNYQPETTTSTVVEESNSETKKETLETTEETTRDRDFYVPSETITGGGSYTYNFEPAPIVNDETTKPQTSVSAGREELPSGIDNMAADCMWKDIYENVGALKKKDGTAYIGRVNLEILKLAASDESNLSIPQNMDNKMKEIILKSYENAHLRDLLEAQGTSELPEGEAGQRLVEEARQLAQQEFESLSWDDLSSRGKARLTLFELSKGRFNPNQGKELEDGQIPDDHRRDSFFYRALCKVGIDFDLGEYRQKIKETLEKQLAGEDVLTRADNINFEPNNVDPSKFTEVTVIGEDGKPMKVHKITVNGIEVYMSLDHTEIYEVSDVKSTKVSGKFGEISKDDINGKVRATRPVRVQDQGITHNEDARGKGDGRDVMGNR